MPASAKETSLDVKSVDAPFIQTQTHCRIRDVESLRNIKLKFKMGVGRELQALDLRRAVEDKGLNHNRDVADRAEYRHRLNCFTLKLHLLNTNLTLQLQAAWRTPPARRGDREGRRSPAAHDRHQDALPSRPKFANHDHFRTPH
ncbi:hypothetical protein EVAR_68017_1 [Eumeta japonica]|uniref:Uncharacterized protein n=1 Tax=Eumeta variegata TaxID=151549 RepID=A0A4C1ZEJ8_EUMVA|nr:hypothetical protein EVAR_68017_1 [Eumeta japonica]